MRAHRRASHAVLHTWSQRQSRSHLIQLMYVYVRQLLGVPSHWWLRTHIGRGVGHSAQLGRCSCSGDRCSKHTRARTQRLLLHRCCPRQTSIAMGGTAGPRDEHGAVLDCAVAHAVSVAEQPNGLSALLLAVQLDRHGRQRKELLQQHARPLARERQPCSHLSPCRLQSHFT